MNKDMSTLPLVSIICITYNHADYIRECLNGFLMQRVNFPIEILVHDDASSDNTPNIIREYEENHPSLFRVIYQTKNQYSQGISPWYDILFPLAKGKYIAICEGDDYWTDPYKLQKQIDFLEANPDYGMCYTSALLYDEKYRMTTQIVGAPFVDYDHMLLSNPVITLTTVLRVDLMKRFLREVAPATHDWKMGDYPMWLWFAYNSNIFYSDNISGVYRHLIKSASHDPNIYRQDKFYKSILDVRLYFFEKFKPTNLDIQVSDLNDEYYRRCIALALVHGNRAYGYEKVKLIQNKNNKDRIKLLFLSNTILFLILKLFLYVKHK